MTQSPRLLPWTPTGRRGRSAGFLVVLAVLSAGTPAWGWGRNQHRAAGRIAEARLTPEALAAVRALLPPGQSLAEASTWADEIRRERSECSPWHYVNVPLSESAYSEKYCPESGCVVGKITEFRKVLADKSLPLERRREALRFVCHFVEDMHQPVHVGDRGDRGGNDTQVQFFGQGSNVHRLWDSGLLERAFPTEDALFADLKGLADSPDASGWGSGTVEAWATESLLAAKGAYRNPKTRGDLKKGAKLDADYSAANLPVARKRLAQSAVRLAWVLNEALGTAAP